MFDKFWFKTSRFVYIGQHAMAESSICSTTLSPWSSDGFESARESVVTQADSSQPVASASQADSSQPVAAGGSARSEDDLLAQNSDLCVWIESQRIGTWRHILKSHMQRSFTLKGPICTQHVVHSLVFEGAPPPNRIKATVSFPNSFDTGDGAACSASVVAIDEQRATTEVCKKLVMQLLLRDALDHYPNSRMVLKTTMWAIPIKNLLQEIARRIHGQFELPVDDIINNMQIMDPSSRCQARRSSMYQEPTDQRARDAEIEALLREISVNEMRVNENGWAKLSNLRTLKAPGGETITPWRELARLVKPGTLLTFLRARPEMFEVWVENGKLLYYRRRGEPEQPLALAQPAAAAPPPQPRQPEQLVALAQPQEPAAIAQPWQPQQPEQPVALGQPQQPAAPPQPLVIHGCPAMLAYPPHPASDNRRLQTAWEESAGPSQEVAAVAMEHVIDARHREEAASHYAKAGMQAPWHAWEAGRHEGRNPYRHSGGEERQPVALAQPAAAAPPQLQQPGQRAALWRNENARREAPGLERHQSTGHDSQLGLPPGCACGGCPPEWGARGWECPASEWYAQWSSSSSSWSW